MRSESWYRKSGGRTVPTMLPRHLLEDPPRPTTQRLLTNRNLVMNRHPLHQATRRKVLNRLLALPYRIRSQPPTTHQTTLTQIRISLIPLPHRSWSFWTGCPRHMKRPWRLQRVWHPSRLLPATARPRSPIPICCPTPPGPTDPASTRGWTSSASRWGALRWPPSTGGWS